jgi:hypothetical protein
VILLETHLMPALLLSEVAIDLKPAKTNGLADLGVPLTDDTVVKKGKLAEFEQLQDSSKVGRRFQNIRVTAVKTSEGGEVSAKVMVVFEVFGDDNAPVAGNQGVSAKICAADKTLLEVPLGTMFMPYACCWYENRFSVGISNELFDQFDRLTFVTRADEVRAL